MPAAQNAYQDRYCAFVDILGFRQLIHQLGNDTASFEILHNLLKRIHGTQSDTDASDSDFRAQSISDAVAISTAINAIGLDQLFGSLQRLSLDLLCEGFFVRGAVVKGPLYHDDQTVFGEGLVRAYFFESEVARYPRIVVTKEVRDDILHYTSRAKAIGARPNMELLRQSADGPMYLDVLQPLVALLRKAESPFRSLTESEKIDHQRYLQIRDKIQQRYGEAMDDPRHFEKVRWFARYWNEVIPSKFFLQISAAEREF